MTRISRTQNNLFPVFLKLEDLHVLIVGGGKTGLEKVTAVLNNSPLAPVTLVAANICEEIKIWNGKFSNLSIHERLFKPEDLEGKEHNKVSTLNSVFIKIYWYLFCYDVFK